MGYHRKNIEKKGQNKKTTIEKGEVFRRGAVKKE